MKTHAMKWILVAVFLLLAGGLVTSADPAGSLSETIQQYGDDVAGPDLQPYERSREKGEIVGKPPAVAPRNTERGKAPDRTPQQPKVTPPVTPPNTSPDTVSVAPKPPELPPRNVAGGLPVQELFDNGALIPVWTGKGVVAGEMLELGLTNTTDQPIAIDMGPGMVLELEDEELARAFQPVMIESDMTILVPANSSITKVLRGYCLDYSLDPPSLGQVYPYRFPADATAYAPAINILKASLTYDAERNVLPPNQQRTVVIQRSIWASLGQGDKQKLYEDIIKDAAAAGKVISKKKARRIADRIWDEVERLIEHAQ